jgi:hypothetical protein
MLHRRGTPSYRHCLEVPMRGLLATVIAASCTAGAIFLAGPAARAAAPDCSGTIQITSLAFDVPQLRPGQVATATVVAQNCTDQQQSAFVQYLGRYVGSTPGIPAGCPAVDPLPQQATIAAGGTFTGSIGYRAFTGCTATGLEVTVSITDSTGSRISRTAQIPIVQAPACTVTYRNTSEWSQGFVAQVTVTNLAATEVNGWTVAFTYPGDQRVHSSWNATVHQTTTTVTAANRPYNAAIAPGAATTFGLQGTWHTSDAAPTAFTLNGIPCQTR